MEHDVRESEAPAGLRPELRNYATFFERFGGSARTKHLEKGASLLSPLRLFKRSRGKRHFPLPKTSGLPPEFIRLCPWEMEYLFAVARRAKKGILEIGRYNGGSTFLLSCANPSVPIYSIDLAPQNDALLQQQFQTHGVGQGARLIIGDSTQIRDDVGEVDLIFIDGDHRYEGCYRDTATWYPRLSERGHLLFHDSYLGRHGVQDAVMDFLEQHPELEVMASPLIGKSYWNYPAGSFAHLRKR